MKKFSTKVPNLVLQKKSWPVSHVFATIFSEGCMLRVITYHQQASTSRAVFPQKQTSSDTWISLDAHLVALACCRWAWPCQPAWRACSRLQCPHGVCRVKVSANGPRPLPGTVQNMSDAAAVSTLCSFLDCDAGHLPRVEAWPTSLLSARRVLHFYSIDGGKHIEQDTAWA